ncbi:AAA family ATPase [Peptococcaceae bacterium 1198_IL3148]
MIFVYGPDEFLKECQYLFEDAVKTWGKPKNNDIVIIGFPGDEGIKLALEMKGPKIYIICPPSLVLWKQITGTNVKWYSSLYELADIESLTEKEKNNKPDPVLNQQFEDEPLIEEVVKVEFEANELEELAPVEKNTAINNEELQLEEPEQVNYQNSEMGKPIKRGYLIPVYSLKGGTGKTTIAQNISAVLASGGKKTCLVDMDLNTKSCSDYMLYKYKPTVNILSWLNCNKLDWDEVNSLLVKVMNGIYLLPGLPNVLQSDLVNEKLTEFILSSLLEHFDYVLVDFGPALLPCTKVALSMSDITIIVASPDVLSESAGNRAHIQLVGDEKLLSIDKVKLIVNMDHARAERRPKEVARNIGFELAAVVPKDEKAIKAATNARPRTLPVLLKKETPIKKAFFSLSEQIILGYEGRQKDNGKFYHLADFLQKVRGIFGNKATSSVKK